MSHKSKATVIALALSLVHCSSMRVYDNVSIVKSLDKAVVDAGAQMQVWRQEIQLHRLVMKKIEAKPNPHWGPVSRQGHALLNAVEKDGSRLELNYKELVAQRAEFSAFAHINPKVFSNEPKWPDAERWAQENVQATQKFNQSLKSFTVAAREMNRFWTDNKLLQKRNVAKLADQLQADTQNWREDYNQLVGHFNSGQARFSEWQQRQPSHWNAKADSTLHPLRRMQHYLATISRLIADLDKLKENYFNSYSGMKEITSLDAAWEPWLQHSKKHQQLESEFNETKEWYQKAFDELTASTSMDIKGLTPLSAETSDQKQSPQ